MAKKKTFGISDSLAIALGETVNAVKQHSGKLNIDVLPIKKIELDPDNPRDLALTFSDIREGLSKDDPLYNRKVNEKESLESIANSIKKQGVLNPIIVYKSGDKYRLIAGERRTLGSTLCGNETIQARILDEKPSQLKTGLLQWIENIEREDLSLWERLKNIEKILTAVAEKRLQTTVDNLSSTEISEILGFSLPHARNYKKVLSASNALNNLIKSGNINHLEKAAFIAGAPIEQQENLISECLKGLSLKQLKSLAEKHKKEINKKNNKEGRGRIATRVTFGTTKNISVAKAIISSVLENPKFQHIKKEVSIDWNDFSSITEAFKNIIESLEKGKK